MALHFFQSLLQHSDSSGSRSTVLKSLTWLLAILFALLGGAITLKAEKFIVIFIMILIGLTIFVFLSSFIYCLFTDKDSLRSESFSIKKLQIEKGIVGDDTAGVIKPNNGEVLAIDSNQEPVDSQEN